MSQLYFKVNCRAIGRGVLGGGGLRYPPPQDWQISHIREIRRSIGRLFGNKKYVCIPHMNEKMVALKYIVQWYKRNPPYKKRWRHVDLKNIFPQILVGCNNIKTIFNEPYKFNQICLLSHEIFCWQSNVPCQNY